jgi:hypothetical protein
MTAPVASGWSIFHPLESAAFARRTPELPLARSAVSGGNAPVTSRSSEIQVERPLLYLANSHTRPKAELA